MSLAVYQHAILTPLFTVELIVTTHSQQQLFQPCLPFITAIPGYITAIPSSHFFCALLENIFQYFEVITVAAEYTEKWRKLVVKSSAVP